MTASPRTPIEAFRIERQLTLEQMAALLGVASKGFVSDLCAGNKPVTVPIARKLEEQTGKPWHEWIEPEKIGGGAK